MTTAFSLARVQICVMGAGAMGGLLAARRVGMAQRLGIGPPT
ncbi:MAG: hypothetical protein M0010_14185 [Actinomycetota bacterium]|nr:hypothetical protein [Actinomycetota bacterium]